VSERAVLAGDALRSYLSGYAARRGADARDIATSNEAREMPKVKGTASVGF
jgi:hypothetical protein